MESTRERAHITKVAEYETFLNDTLKQDLGKIVEERDKIFSQIAEYLQLKTVIERVQESKIGSEGLKTKVDLGCNFYVQAHVPDTSKIFVSVGFGFFVEFTHGEALKFIEKKTERLNSAADELTKKAAKVKAHIKLVVEGLRELQNIEVAEEKPRRDIWS